MKKTLTILALLLTACDDPGVQACIDENLPDSGFAPEEEPEEWDEPPEPVLPDTQDFQIPDWQPPTPPTPEELLYGYCHIAHRLYFTTRLDNTHIPWIDWPCIWADYEPAECFVKYSTAHPEWVTTRCEWKECGRTTETMVSWPTEPGITEITFYNPCLQDEWDLPEDVSPLNWPLPED